MRSRTVLRGWVLALGIVAVLAPSTALAEDKDDPIVAAVRKKLKDPNKPFMLVVSLKVKEGAGEKFEAAFAKALQGTRKEKGCISYDLNRDSEDATRYLVYERWKTLADLEAHLKTDHIKALRTVLPDVINGDPELKVGLPASE